MPIPMDKNHSAFPSNHPIGSLLVLREVQLETLAKYTSLGVIVDPQREVISPFAVSSLLFRYQL
jgi:hypothetical protein